MSQPATTSELAIVPANSESRAISGSASDLGFAQKLASLTADLVGDIFLAYGLSLVEMSDRVRQIYLTQLSGSRKTFPYLMEVILSDRHPFTVMKLACKLGMYLPTHHRVGLKAYRFYLLNVRYYEGIFERMNCRVPTLMDMCLLTDPVNNLMKFRDDEILKPGYKFDRNYSDRREMISGFVELNIYSHGIFTLQSNSRRCYNLKDKNILYQEGDKKFLYGVGDLIKLCDFSKKVVWSDYHKQKPFSSFSLHLLRQRILEKFSQWKQADYYHSNVYSPDLYKLFCSLDDLLKSESRVDAGSYLGQPKIPVKF